MDCIELPKDAYGRVIPLNTGTLYKKNGVAVFIYHYDYDPRGKAWYGDRAHHRRGNSEGAGHSARRGVNMRFEITEVHVVDIPDSEV